MFKLQQHLRRFRRNYNPQPYAGRSGGAAAINRQDR